MTGPADAALEHLQRLLSRDPMLRDVLAQAVPSLAHEGSFVPAVDVHDMGDHHLVLVDLPGVQRANVRVRLEGAHLVLDGHRTTDTPEGARSPTRERGHGNFRRTFLLPDDVDAEGVRAELNDGVLTVTVPRAPQQDRGREVPIG